MDISKAKPNQALMPQRPQLQLSAQEQKQEQIMRMLAKLGVRRQAKLATEDYLVLAEDLETWDLRDLEKGFDDLGKRTRQEGETSFPDLGTIREACSYHRMSRRTHEAIEAQRREDEELRKDREAHPENYWNPKEDEEFQKLLAKVSSPPPKPAQPIVHGAIRTMQMEKGWFRGYCICGKTWDTFGEVRTCPVQDWKQFNKDVQDALGAKQ